MFEAFNARTISKTLNFLDKEVSKTEKDKFLSSFKRFGSQYDLPIDKINDEHLDYFGKSDALKIGETERLNINTNNKYGIYAIKFWFSTESGYSGYSAVGNVTYNETTIDSSLYPPKNRLSDSGIESGILTPVKGPEKDLLKTGDKIVAVLSGNDREWSKLTIATIVREGNQLYAIQNITEGGAPGGDWRKFGRYSWNIGSTSRLGDASYLCRYEDDGKPLRYDIDVMNTSTSNIFEYNLPLRLTEPSIIRWMDNNKSISREQVEKADFAIIFYFDKMISSLTYTRPSEKKSLRTASKKGAYALMSNKDVRDKNIQKYISSIINSMGISDDKINYTKLHKVPAKALMGDFALIALKSGNANSIITQYQSYIIEMIGGYESGSKDDQGNLTGDGAKETLRNRITQLIDMTNRAYDNQIHLNIRKNYELSLKQAEGDPLTKQILEKTTLIGRKISESFSKYPVNTVIDLQIFTSKITSLYNLFGRGKGFQLTSTISNIYESFHQKVADDTEYYITQLINKPDDWKEKEIKTLDNILNYVEVTL